MQRTNGKHVRLDDKDAAIFSTPFHHKDQDMSKHTVIHPDVGIHMNRLVRLKVPSTVVELWRIWTAMLDIVASGAEVMATGPCRLCDKMGVDPVILCGLFGCEWHRSCCCEKLSPGTLSFVSERLRPHMLPDIIWGSKLIGALCSLCERWLEQSI